ncbi:hypothetical protein [Amycolatopsis mediterranei]|uniref:Uncharacterized protein n=1 Tax=Amycolatopsis mediterranei (strain S699) TaxID=713604 RepID=A0A9R0UBU9_AMYMS|nr:hypothetical protein [Amycolatopsis mediterranei]AEK45090.1 hypothetical protein RAM_33085 [Amycolatopsis mediterranei S699]KDO10671.1 hypothetical protein DV26_12345 [Amycolatopsis mediterranei]KDU87133.1 hypothetical protein DV36_38095 [Amycolatopsis mediterranei]UZF73184.1 hypothetical protein ISP_006603 [Amycolatopsis mediterranei]
MTVAGTGVVVFRPPRPAGGVWPDKKPSWRPSTDRDTFGPWQHTPSGSAAPAELKTAALSSIAAWLGD